MSGSKSIGEMMMGASEREIERLNNMIDFYEGEVVKIKKELAKKEKEYNELKDFIEKMEASK